MISAVDLNSLDYWFPKIEEAGLHVPRTTIVYSQGDLSSLLDGEKPEHWDEFLALMQAACYDHGVPCFLRTGHGSDKHGWKETCFIENVEFLGWHIGRLVEWSHMAGIMGLPHEVWAVRDLIPNVPLFTLKKYEEMPYVPEWRFFVRDGEIEHIQPYWPLDALEQGNPSAPNWRKIVQDFHDKMDRDDAYIILGPTALDACQAVGGGYWSVDFLWSSVDGTWWLTDMAEGDRSFRYEP